MHTIDRNGCRFPARFSNYNVGCFAELFHQRIVFFNCMLCQKTNSLYFFLLLHPLLRFSWQIVWLSSPFKISTLCPSLSSTLLLQISLFHFTFKFNVFTFPGHLFFHGFLYPVNQILQLFSEEHVQIFHLPLLSPTSPCLHGGKLLCGIFQYLLCAVLGLYFPHPILIISMPLYITGFCGDLILRIPLIALPLSRVND